MWRPLLDPDTRRLGSEVLAKLRGDGASPARLSGALLSKPTSLARPDDSHLSLPPHTHPSASSPSDRRASLAKERGEEAASEAGGGACGGGGVVSVTSPTKHAGPLALLPIFYLSSAAYF
jgi:hypothetical protein